MAQDAVPNAVSEQQESDYDCWFREQVEEGLREADDPNAIWISHEQVLRDIDEFRKTLASGNKERDVA